MIEKNPASLTEIITRYSETDQGGRIYHANYLVWLDVARTDYFRSIGIAYDELERLGYYLVIKNISCDFLSPSHYNECLTIQINKVKLSSVKLEFYYKIFKDNIDIATAYTKLAFVNEKGELIKIPHHVWNLIEKS